MTFIYDANLPYDSDQAYDAYAPSGSAVVQTVLAHLALPLQLRPDGSFNWVVQDSITEVVQSVEMIAGSVQGERPVSPNFGLKQLAFTSPTAASILQTITTQEDRAAVTATSVIDAQGEDSVRINVALKQLGR